MNQLLKIIKMLLANVVTEVSCLHDFNIIFYFFKVLYLPIVIYVPALAFQQVTGVAVHTITPIVCLICIFYTGLVCKEYMFYYKIGINSV